jgi:hypothetical protein
LKLELSTGRLTGFLEVRPNVRAAIAASSAHELILKVGEPNMVGPLIGVDACPMQTAKIGAVDD